jgi:hypothetical protein
MGSNTEAVIAHAELLIQKIDSEIPVMQAATTKADAFHDSLSQFLAAAAEFAAHSIPKRMQRIHHPL